MEQILIISDLHFGCFFDPKFNNVEELRKGVVKCISDAGLKPTYLLCLGDLTSKGKDDEFTQSLLFLRTLANDLSITDDSVLALVGNHDIDWDLNDILTRENYNSDIARHVSASIQANYHWPKFSVIGPVYGSGIVHREGYNIIALNSSWNCIGDSRKHGEIGGKQIEWLRSLTTDHLRNLPSVLALHHHPDPLPYNDEKRDRDISQVIDGQSLMGVCYDIDVQLIVHGHRHEPIIVRRNSVKGVKRELSILCTGSLSVEAGKRTPDLPNFLHVLSFDPLSECSVLHTYNSTAKGMWDCEYNSAYHELIAPLSGVAGKGFRELSDEEIDHELTALVEKNLPIKFDNVPASLKCKSAADVDSIIKTHADKMGKSVWGLYHQGGVRYY